MNTFDVGGQKISMGKGFAIQTITFGKPFGAKPLDVPAIWANLRVASVSDGTLVDVSYVEKLACWPKDPRVLGELVRAATLRALEHELDERLHVNGVLLRTPHPEKWPK